MAKTGDASKASSTRPLRLAVLISGGGRTLINLAEQIEAGELAAEIVCVISSRGDAAGVERARQRGLAVHVVERTSFRGRGRGPDAFSDGVWPIVRQSGAELVCLAGFLSLLVIPDDFAGRVINIHPALLPRFGGPGMFGHHVHEAVLAAGCKESGCTVHYCDQTYDTGAIIVQRTCPVLPGDTADTLAARVFEQECIAYPQAIRKLAAEWADR
ncbi:MAG: phosphoribosylglycinamide formyltransferase [Phycisphaeraceae bacterium]|nr:phosphoribosylglycinamide formyltransferase [Phycisphaeraceae bacterium]